MSLIRYLINRLTSDNTRYRVSSDLVAFVSYYVFSKRPSVNKFVDDKSDEDF